MSWISFCARVIECIFADAPRLCLLFHCSTYIVLGALQRQENTVARYAERQRLRYETERLDEKRAQNMAAKSDKARKAFLMELQERRKMEQLKAAARQKRIEEERCPRAAAEST